MIPANGSNKNILITGNGFDISLNLQTRYSDFIKSTNFKLLIEQNNSLAIHLSTIFGEKNWVDIELELEIFIKKISQNRTTFDNNKFNLINIEYIKLKLGLQKYLEKEQSKLNFDNYKLDKNLKFDEVYTFNFTDSAKLVPSNTKQPLVAKHLHGSLENDDIIFGTRDSGIPYEFIFIKKSSHENYGNYNFGKIFSYAQPRINLHFFGLSFGESDDAYFPQLFSNLLTNVSKDCQLTFYAHDFESYKALYNRISVLTGNRMSTFRQNDVKFMRYDDESGIAYVQVTEKWKNEQILKQSFIKEKHV